MLLNVLIILSTFSKIVPKSRGKCPLCTPSSRRPCQRLV